MADGTPRRVAVVGGGISGLAAAHRVRELSAQRRQPVSVEVLEATDRLGGVIASRRRQGFLLEEGPDSILTEKPWALDLARRLGIGHRVIGTREEYRRSFVVHRGRLHSTPDGFYLLAPTHLLPLAVTPLFSPAGKLRMAMDLVLPRRRGRGDESLASFVRRRLGREALERMAQPMVAGIYGADPERLSLQATFPRFHRMEDEHRSIILALRAGIRQRRQQARRRPEGSASGARYSLFASFDGGLQVLTDALAACLPREALRTGSPVTTAYPAEGGTWRLRAAGSEERFDGLILAVPAHQAADLIGPFDARLSRKIATVPYGSSATVSLAYRQQDVDHPLDGVGFVVPSSEGMGMIGCTFSHRKYAQRAPEGHALLRAFHGAAALEATDDGLAEATHRELRPLLGLRADPVLAHVARWPDSMAQFEVGHLERVEEIWEALRAHPGLALAGNGYRGIGVPDCVRSGEQAAEAVMARLAPAP